MIPNKQQQNPSDMTISELHEEIRVLQENLTIIPSEPFNDYDNRSFRLYNLISEVNSRV